MQSRSSRNSEPYLAPELLPGKPLENVSPYGDIWSLGCILFNLATGGRKAFTSNFAVFMYGREVEGYGPSQLGSTISGFSNLDSGEAVVFRNAVNSVLEGCFASEPQERPTSMELSSRFTELKHFLSYIEV